MNTITNTNTSTAKKIYRPSRPSRYQKWTAGFEVSAQAVNLTRALRSVRAIEEQFVDMAGDVQEGAAYSATAFENVNARYDGAKKQLRQMQAKAGLR